MTDTEALRRFLKEEYGIGSELELEKAVMKMPKIKIGVFISKTERSTQNDYEKENIA